MKPVRPQVLIVSILCMVLALVLAACGGETPTLPTPPTSTPTPEPAPSPMPTTPVMSEEEKLAEYASQHAGGPGAIFVGDPIQLPGPPSHEALMLRVPEEQYNTAFLGALYGVPERGLSSQMFIYNSDYYQGLIQKAKLTDPTPLTSSGESIEIQHTCLDRGLPTCILVESYWAPNVAKRTNGQVKISITSFVELGLAGPDTLGQVGDGTLDMVDIYSGYVAGALPPTKIQSPLGHVSGLGDFIFRIE